MLTQTPPPPFFFFLQLKEENHYTEEMVQYSLFPRIIPPRELCEPNTSTLITQATPHPSFIPFKNRTVLSYGKGIEQALETMRGNMYRPSLLESELNLIGRAVHDVKKNKGERGRYLY